MLYQTELEQRPAQFIYPHNSEEITDSHEECIRNIGPSVVASALILAEAAGIIEFGSMLPIAAVLGSLQVTRKYPVPPELNRYIASRDITGAINCIGRYAYNNAHHLLDEDNIVGNTVNSFSVPIELGKLVFSRIFTNKPST